jgi:hypothetical protein
VVTDRSLTTAMPWKLKFTAAEQNRERQHQAHLDAHDEGVALAAAPHSAAAPVPPPRDAPMQTVPCWVGRAAWLARAFVGGDRG